MSKAPQSQTATYSGPASLERSRGSSSPGFVRAARDRLEAHFGKSAHSAELSATPPQSHRESSQHNSDQAASTVTANPVQQQQLHAAAPPMTSALASDYESQSEPSISDFPIPQTATTEDVRHEKGAKAGSGVEREAPDESAENAEYKVVEDGQQSESPKDPFADVSGSSSSSSPNQTPTKPSGQETRTLHSAAPRRTPLGPPPSARRGAPSYYPHNAVVTPIIEESESYRSRTSYASVLPEDGTTSGRGSVTLDRDSQTGVVRKASLGKRHSPNLTTIKSGKLLGLDGNGLASTNGYGLQKASLVSHRTDSMDTSAPLPATPSRGQSSLELLDEKSIGGARMRSRSPKKSLDVPVARASEASDRADVISAVAGPSAKLPTTLSARVGSRVPARINVDATKQAEQRASLSSLTELIRRATRLASNLDRGKTASRLGVDAWVNEKLPSSSGNGIDSLSDVLGPEPPADLIRTKSASSTAAGRRRKCCGMPLWVAVLLFVTLIILIAAAIIIPVALIVVPRQNKHDDPSTTVPKALALCQQTLPCANGGVSITSMSGSCRCICVNGHTGDQCRSSFDAGCITSDMGSVHNATVGSFIPRLLVGAQTNFSVPLNASAILSLFAAQNLTCSSENALVTFNGLTTRSVSSDEVSLPILPQEPLVSPLPTPRIERRQASSSVQSVLTSNGIVFAAGSPSSTASTTTSSPTASPTLPSTSSNYGSPFRTPSDFAPITVLYILQQSMQFDTAATAQQYLQDYFVTVGKTASDGRDPRNVTLGSGWEALFPSFQIRLNGAVVAGGS